MTQYKFTTDEAKEVHKHGIDLTIYPLGVERANVVHVSVEEGHFQEFSDKESYYMYYIYEGSGLFVLNDEKIEAKATDIIVIPPNTRIHYFGTMKMVLTVSPRYNPDNETHHRFVDRSESPFLGGE